MSTAPKRRWFRFSLRTMLLLVAIVSIPTAWIAKERRQSFYELQAAELLQRQGINGIELGGIFDLNTRGKPRAWWRDVARFIIGERILQVNSSGDASNVTNLESLAGLKNVRSVSLIHAPISDLSPLTALTSLEYLNLYGEQAHDLSPLSGLKGLKRLDLGGLPFRDITPLTELSNLAFLDIRYTSVTKEQVEILQKALPNCEIQYYRLP